MEVLNTNTKASAKKKLLEGIPGACVLVLESTRIRICLIDRLLDFELASGKVRLDVPAKPYDNVE